MGTSASVEGRSRKNITVDIESQSRQRPHAQSDLTARQLQSDAISRPVRRRQTANTHLNVYQNGSSSNGVHPGSNKNMQLATAMTSFDEDAIDEEEARQMYAQMNERVNNQPYTTDKVLVKNGQEERNHSMAADRKRPEEGQVVNGNSLWQQNMLDTRREEASNLPSSARSTPRPAGGSEQQADDVFETYTSPTGEEYMVFVRDDGKRFYMDWEKSQNWQPFPDEWLQHGTLESLSRDHSKEGHGKSSSTKSTKENTQDERSGNFKHPTRGPLMTYLFETKLTVMCFLDQDSGEWMRMPPAWELQVPAIRKIVDNIKRCIPEWKDDCEILSWLRVMNYNSENVISEYLTARVYGGVELTTAPAVDALKTSDSERVQSQAPTTAELIQHLQEALEKRVMELREASYEGGQLKERVKFLQSELEQVRKDIDRLQHDNINLRVDVETQKHEIKLLNHQVEKLERRLEEADKMPSQMQLLAQLMPKHQPVAQLEISPKTVSGVNRAARSVRAMALALRQAVAREFTSMAVLLQKANTHLEKLHDRVANFDVGLEHMRSLYMKEFLQRKLLFNQLQELRGNIRVFCRSRPANSGSPAVEFLSDTEVQIYNPQGHRRVFEFERVFSPSSTQEEVFSDTLPIITSCVDGYNVCLLAYGQTGAGKTYTMMGTARNPGINIRALSELLKICHERKQIQYTLKVAMLEIYNETIYDLFSTSTSSQKLNILRKGKAIIVPGLTEVEVSTVQEIVDLMQLGHSNRSVAMTAMNTESSRSHLLLKLSVVGVDRLSKATSHGSLHLVDLAGSERISRSEATGHRLVEAAAINKSLSALGQVFTSLRNNTLHVPYRNSKLTHLLQPCLGGDAKACMFVNISPSKADVLETISTLQFGQSARQVALGQAHQNIIS